MTGFEVVEDARGFASLKGEWRELYDASPRATPFQSWEWLYSWWESYGEGRGLRLIVVRSDEGLLVGVLPLMVERRQGVRRLLLVGTRQTDYLDAVVREGWEEEVSEAAFRALSRVGSWHVADFQEVRPEAALWEVVGRWEVPQTRLRHGMCPVVEIGPWEETVASLSKNHRHSVRKAVRRAEADGLVRGMVGPEEVDRATRALAEMLREQWRGHPLTGEEHFSRRYEDFLAASARRMTEGGMGGISEFRRDGEPVLSTFVLFGRDFVGTYVMSVKAGADKRYQWGSLYIWDAMDLGRDRGLRRLDLLRGLEPYKLRWEPEMVVNQRLILGRNLVFWCLYSFYQALRQDEGFAALKDRARGAAERIRALLGGKTVEKGEDS